MIELNLEKICQHRAIAYFGEVSNLTNNKMEYLVYCFDCKKTKLLNNLQGYNLIKDVSIFFEDAAYPIYKFGD